MNNLTESEKLKMCEAIKQADAIHALEGFKKTEESRKMDDALIAGRVSSQQIIDEMIEFAKEHKSIDGFVESRMWA